MIRREKKKDNSKKRSKAKKETWTHTKKYAKVFFFILLLILMVFLRTPVNTAGKFVHLFRFHRYLVSEREKTHSWDGWSWCAGLSWAVDLEWIWIDFFSGERARCIQKITCQEAYSHFIQLHPFRVRTNRKREKKWSKLWIYSEFI